MQFPIPFTKYGVTIDRRGIQFTDRSGTLGFAAAELWQPKYYLKANTPILENIYDTIASEFSKIDLILSKNTRTQREDGSISYAYVKQRDNPNYDILALRPNALQTKSDLLYTIAYQLHSYGNALVLIRRDTRADRNVVLSLEPLNLEDYEFGHGYEIAGGLYLKLRDKKSGSIILLDYSDVLHLRLNPNDVFFGDKSAALDLTSFIKVFDENLNALFNELKESGTVNGIVEIGGGIGSGYGFNSALANTDDKISKQSEVIERIKATKGGVLVLDAGEKWHQMSRTFRTMTDREIDTLMRYLYNFKGINQKIINGTATEEENEVFFNKTIMPIIERFLEELNYKFLTQTARTQGQVIEYFKNPFEYMATKDLLSNLYLGAMFFTQNEIRHMAFRLSPIEGGDVLMDNKNFEKLRVKNGKDEKTVKKILNNDGEEEEDD